MSDSNTGEKIFPGEPSQETLKHYIDYTWKDIHHSRLQNWTGITVVTAFHIGIFKVVEFLYENSFLNTKSKIVIFSFGALFCAIGYLITFLHQKQMYERLGRIKRAEQMLGTETLKHKLEKQNNEPQQENSSFAGKMKKFLKRNFCTVGALMGYFFFLLLILDILCIFLVQISFS